MTLPGKIAPRRVRAGCGPGIMAEGPRSVLVGSAFCPFSADAARLPGNEGTLTKRDQIYSETSRT